MKKVLLASLLASFSSSVFAFDNPFSCWCFDPYVGAEAAMRYSRFQRNFGNNIFKKYYPEGNVFFGVKFSDYLGVEAGYKISVTKTRVNSLGAGEVAVGIPPEFPPELHRGIASFKGWHAEIVGFIPVYQQDCISLIGSLGVSRTKLFARDKIVQDFAVGLIAYPDSSSVRTFAKTKNILTLGAGVQAAIDENTYCRLKVNWENTSSFKAILAKENANAILKLRDSLSYGISVVFSFF